jgi:hypothetical protein
LRAGDNSLYVALNGYRHFDEAIRCRNKGSPENKSPSLLVALVKMKSFEQVQFCLIENLNSHEFWPLTVFWRFPNRKNWLCSLARAARVPPVTLYAIPASECFSRWCEDPPIAHPLLEVFLRRSFASLEARLPCRQVNRFGLERQLSKDKFLLTSPHMPLVCFCSWKNPSGITRTQISNEYAGTKTHLI